MIAGNPPENQTDRTGDGDEADMEAVQRPAYGGDVELNVFDAVRAQSANPVQPVRLTEGDSFCFRCHRGVSCWNTCCHGADITLPPYDIIRLAKHLEMRQAEFLVKYTVPAEHEGASMPVVKIKMGGDDGKGACPFMNDEGCTVYDDRPSACRYYPLGLMSVKMKEADAKDDFYFIVREEHCRGHDETQQQSVVEFRKEQGAIPYEEINRGWIDILMKLASWRSMGGVMGKEPSAQMRQMFFMVSSDVDKFRRFVFESRFLQVYDIPEEALQLVRENDEVLLRLGFDWLKNVLFNEPTIGMRHEILQDAIARARTNTGGA
jgi:Fe-S-cluster containining protein